MRVGAYPRQPTLTAVAPSAGCRWPASAPIASDGADRFFIPQPNPRGLGTTADAASSAVSSEPAALPP